MPFKSDAQRRLVYAKANEGEPWARKFIGDAHEESHSGKRGYQPSFGNGGKGHGSRQKDDVKKAEFSKGIGRGAAERLARSSYTMSPEEARHHVSTGRWAVLGGTTGSVGLAASLGRKKKKVAKSRFYDPEHRRQRRLGMGQAALAGAGATGLVLGGRGAVKSTKAVRDITTRVPGKSVKGVSNIKRYGDTESGKRILALRRRDAALLAGGTAGAGGALGLRSYAESRRGGAWR
ncbi:MAG TPA: hypothetical protein VIT65_22245 [Microlunatus sp.]